MTVPSQMSLRRIPDALHLPVRVAYAMSWEALIDTHTRQAVQFVTEFAPRISVLRGLDLYFQVTAVPEAMQEVVRSRTLTGLDLSNTLLETLRRKMSGVALVQGNAEDLSFADESFDAVVVFAGLHHLPRFLLGRQMEKRY